MSIIQIVVDNFSAFNKKKISIENKWNKIFDQRIFHLRFGIKLLTHHDTNHFSSFVISFQKIQGQKQGFWIEKGS